MRHNSKTSKSSAKSRRNQLRIIGGDWRGRKLDFPDAQGLRPTPDRVRETLFNWLMPMIRGAHCLDVFAGSGVLGFEALSRGATELVLVDSQHEVITALQKNLKILKADQTVQLQQADAMTYLSQLDKKFDLVFLDPPYHQGLLQPCIDALYARQILKPSAYLYFEANRNEVLPILPKTWNISRQKSAGQVSYFLVHKTEPG